MASTRATVQGPWSSPVIDRSTLTILKWQKLKILTWEFLRELNQDQGFCLKELKRIMKSTRPQFILSTFSRPL